MIEKFCIWLSKKLNNITINVKGVPYLSRFYLLLKDRELFNVFLHHFHSSDQKNELHSHPFKWGFGFVLSGGYFEERLLNTPYKKDAKIIKKHVKPFSFNFLTYKDFHRVDLVDEQKGSWTLFVTGRRLFDEAGKPDWGFIDRDTLEYSHFSNNPEAIP